MKAVAAQKAAELEAQIQARQPKQVAVTVPQPPGPEGVAREAIVADADGRLLWASPTAGPAIALRYLPAGALCLVAVRPAALATHSERDKILAALGPWGERIVDALQTATGANVEELESVVAAVVAERSGELDVVIVATPVKAASWDDDELGRRFPGSQRQQVGDGVALVDGKRARFLAALDNPSSRRAVVVCSASRAEDLIDSGGEPPLLARDIENLVATSDADRDLTVIVSPKFLAADGGNLLPGRAEPLREALGALVGDQATAVALSAHWGDEFFVEIRATPALNVSPRWLATTIAQRLAAAPDEIGGLVAHSAWTDYGKLVVERFPAMLRQLAKYARHGDVDRQAVVRAYLPAVAGHNLVMGAELLLTQAAGAAGADSTAANPHAAPRSLDERLAATMALAFPRESLERALELWSAAAGIEVAVDGPAFQAEGITRNQTLELDLRDQSAAQVLLEILRRANPDRTAENAADPRQKLVYVVDPTAAPLGRMIVTTRAAVAERGLPLPAVFAAGGE